MISPKMNVLDYKWIGLIRDRLDSGLTVVEWCRQHDIRTKTYFYHQTRLKKMAIIGAVDQGMLPECLLPDNAVSHSLPVVQETGNAKPAPMFTPVPTGIAESIRSEQTARAAPVRITQGSLVIEISNDASGEVLSLTVANCWIHAKRPFAKVVKINTEGMENSIAHKACRLIENIFHEEEKLRDLTPEERLKQKQDKIAPLVDAYFAWLKQIRPYVASKSKTGAGITYNLDQEEYLRKFLTDGEIPMTNNAAERAIRPFVLGRKNWYLVDTRSGAESTAILYSMAETAKANNVKPYE